MILFGREVTYSKRKAGNGMVLETVRQTNPRRRLFTIDEYEQMIEAGVFDEDEHIELIRGEIVKTAALGELHEACVRRLTKLLERRAGDVAMVSIQNSIRLPVNKSQPQPDAALLRLRDDFYDAHRPLPHDVFLVIEVAKSSLRRDRKEKVPIYAEAGIPEVWVVDLKHDIIEVYTSPMGGEYQHIQRLGRGETLRLSVGVAVTITVAEVLGFAKL